MRMINDKCNNCGACKKVCKVNAIIVSDIHRINQELCNDCLACVSECPNNAIVEYIEPIEEPTNYEDLMP